MITQFIHVISTLTTTFFYYLKNGWKKKSFICIRRNHIFQVELEKSLEKISLQMNLFTFFTKKLTILTHLTSQIT